MIVKRYRKFKFLFNYFFRTICEKYRLLTYNVVSPIIKKISSHKIEFVKKNI